MDPLDESEVVVPVTVDSLNVRPGVTTKICLPSLLLLLVDELSIGVPLLETSKFSEGISHFVISQSQPVHVEEGGTCFVITLSGVASLVVSTAMSEFLSELLPNMS